MESKKRTNNLLILAILLFAISFSFAIHYFYTKARPALIADTNTGTQRLGCEANSIPLNGDYIYKSLTKEANYSSNVHVSCIDTNSIDYHILTSVSYGISGEAYSGELEGKAYKNADSTSVSFTNKEYNKDGESEGCKVTIIFNTDGTLKYKTDTVKGDNIISDCNSYAGTRGEFFGDIVHKK